MKNSIFWPVIDNGGGMSRTGWGLSMFALGLSGVLAGRRNEIQGISYPYPSGACNIATMDFLESKCDEMVILDTDLIFTSQDVEMLLSHDVPLVAGLYPKKQVGCNWPMAFLDPEQKTFTDDPEPLVEVACIARGFMRIHRSVFESMATFCDEYEDPDTKKQSREFWKMLPGGHSEDFRFCSDYRALGGKVYVDKRVCVRHEGSAVYPIPGTY